MSSCYNHLPSFYTLLELSSYSEIIDVHLSLSVFALLTLVKSRGGGTGSVGPTMSRCCHNYFYVSIVRCSRSYDHS